MLCNGTPVIARWGCCLPRPLAVYVRLAQDEQSTQTHTHHVATRVARRLDETHVAKAHGAADPPKSSHGLLPAEMVWLCRGGGGLPRADQIDKRAERREYNVRPLAHGMRYWTLDADLTCSPSFRTPPHPAILLGWTSTKPPPRPGADLHTNDNSIRTTLRPT